MEADTLMYQAFNYYVTSNKAEKWEYPSHKDEQNIALEVQVTQLESNASYHTLNTSQPDTPCTRNSPPGGNTCNVKPA